jgi:hypothetical protein
MSRRNEKMPMSVAIFPMMKKVQIEYESIFGEVSAKGVTNLMFGASLPILVG